MEFVARVFVTPKAAILDPQGKAVASSLKAMGYDEVADARVGKMIVLNVMAADRRRAHERVTEMCRRLLANEVIEDFELEIADGGKKAR
jgi:phosphoribosylformylglycinamidine synthase